MGNRDTNSPKGRVYFDLQKIEIIHNVMPLGLDQWKMGGCQHKPHDVTSSQADRSDVALSAVV